ncbi:hypothetical protein EVAR_22228_1 [Eumeta japonica]|uniref:Uncharacterized protein n=1 Tax=Eumeta variegata TaxID=151549 RepID=A0A4C1UB72_EUMVA|nr:hypothetical protein EVAR_22228_1 [Eumeta japonica]
MPVVTVKVVEVEAMAAAASLQPEAVVTVAKVAWKWIMPLLPLQLHSQQVVTAKVVMEVDIAMPLPQLLQPAARCG